MPSRPTPRDTGRINRAVAGAEDRAIQGLKAIEKSRVKGRAITAVCISTNKDIGDAKDSWPLHAYENRPITITRDVPIEGQARMAYARQRAGLRLSDADRAALDRYPDGGPWQHDFETWANEHTRLTTQGA